MSNLKACYQNRADSATLTANPVAASSYPVTYLQNDERGYVFRSTSTAAQEVKGTWGGTAYTIGCAVLYRHNLVDGDTWRVQLYSGTAWTTSVYDSGTVSAFASGMFADWDWGFSVMYFTAVAGVKSFKITVTSSSNPDGYVEAGRLLLGPVVDAPYNPKYGFQIGWADGSSKSRNPGGSVMVEAGGRYRQASFDMLLASEADRAAWLEIGRACGASKTLWLSAAAGLTGAYERDLGMLGQFDQSPAQRFSSYNIYDMSLQFSEV